MLFNHCIVLSVIKAEWGAVMQKAVQIVVQ
jgi:hypothetical protein